MAAEVPLFHPRQLPQTAFYVESIHGVSLARCDTEACFEAGDNAPLDLQYCDLETFPDGCVRRWEDQSGYRPSRGFEPPEWTRGRDFGQDDADKPGFVADCLNGQPCVRGGQGGTQDRSFEIELGQTLGPINGPFSVFLLAKPVAKEVAGDDFYYFGFGGAELSQNVRDQSLRLRLGFRSPRTLTAPGAVTLGEWHLIEVHRDARGRVKALVDGWDYSLDPERMAGEFHFRFLFSVSRGRAMHGDIAACLVTDGLVSEVEARRVRDYLGEVYGLEFGDGSPPPLDAADLDTDRGLVLHWTFDGLDECRVSGNPGPAGNAGRACAKGPRAVPGRVGGALLFDGHDDSVVADRSRPLDQLFRLSVSAWIKTRPSAEGWQAVVDKRDALEDGWDLYVSPDGKPFFRVDDAVLRGHGLVDDDRWHHIVGVYDGNRLLLYLDGRLDRSWFIDRAISLGTQRRLRVGRNFEDQRDAFTGAIDDVRVYSRALMPQEIAALAAGGGYP